MHTNGFLHRNIKVSNLLVLDENTFLIFSHEILFSPFCRIKICDFSNARETVLESPPITSRVGSLIYQSPELVAGHVRTELDDTWAFGCVMYQMCCLEHPFARCPSIDLRKAIKSLSFVPINEHPNNKTEGVFSSFDIPLNTLILALTHSLTHSHNLSLSLSLPRRSYLFV